MPELLRAEAAAGIRSSHKAVIMIFLPGGPPHQDMFDLKTDAPAEIRGEFTPIKTNVPGIEICELLPRLAAMMDKLVVIRSIVGATGDHYAFQCLTGRTHRQQPPGGWPSLGSLLSKLKGAADPAVPPFVGLSPKMGHMPWADSGQPGFLGIAHAPFKPDGDGKADMVLNGISLDRLRDRTGAADGLRPLPPRRRLDRHDARDGRLQPAGLRRAHVEQAGRRARSVEGGPQGRRALRPRRCRRTATTAGRS